MNYRHEIKYYINRKDAYILAKRLDTVLARDPNCGDSGYDVTSLYFDTVFLHAYHQKVNGISDRKKIRIRAYNYSKGLIRLEVKRKAEVYTQKDTAQISFDEYQSIIHGGAGFPLEWVQKKNPAMNQWMISANVSMLKPVVLVDYRRQVFVDSGDLRISFDGGLRFAPGSASLFSANNHYLSVLPEDTVIMEVKYAGYLPAYIDALLSGVRLQHVSVSKYVLCMDKLKGVKHYA